MRRGQHGGAGTNGLGEGQGSAQSHLPSGNARGASESHLHVTSESCPLQELRAGTEGSSTLQAVRKYTRLGFVPAPVAVLPRCALGRTGCPAGGLMRGQLAMSPPLLSHTPPFTQRCRTELQTVLTQLSRCRYLASSNSLKDKNSQRSSLL